MKSTYEITVKSLCEQVDRWKEEAEYWQAEYQKERDLNQQRASELLAATKKSVGQALMFALAVKDTPDGSLVIDPKDRKRLSGSFNS